MTGGRVVIRTPRLTIEGKSRAGNETWFRVRELGIALDIGRCPDLLVGTPNVFITHAHLDHALGVPYYAAQRRLHRLGAGRVFVPAESAADYRELMALHERMEDTLYPLDIVGLAPGETRPLRRDLLVRAHSATHRVVANGWEFCEVRHKLKAEHASRTPDELRRLREDGVAVDVLVERPILFYTGDTDRRILEGNEALYRAEVLMIECSFTAPGEEERGRKYAHIHLSDIWDHAERFENELIVLTHFSLRDSAKEIHRRVADEAPAALRGRLALSLPEPHTRVT